MADTKPREWYLNKGIYPPPAEIAAALQDRGKADAKGKQRYPLLEKLASKVHAAILKECDNPEGLTVNRSRGKLSLVQGTLMCRKHVDVHESHSFFHECGADGKVYLICNQPENSRLDRALMHYQNHISQTMKQKSSARTHNDGLRLACILLDSQWRGTVSGIMSKRKDRKKSDITGDPTLHFYEQTLGECFNSRECVASRPADVHYNDFPEEEREKWDPNHTSIFEHQRTAVWLKDTWDNYVRPKYKKALDKWNKDTGGGDGSATKFVDFCSADKWLVWVFCKDIEANFLLANSASGRMPRHLQIESGFPEDVSDLSGNSKAFEDELCAVKAQREKTQETLDEMALCVKEQRAVQASKSKIVTEMDGMIEQVESHSLKLHNKTVLDTMSPGSKEVCVQSIKRRRKDILEKMSGTTEEEEG